MFSDLREEENDRFQEEINRLRGEINRISNVRVYYEENLKLCKWQEQQINKLATAIEKIAELAQDFCNACKEFEPEKCKDSNCIFCNYHRILQLISEVITNERHNEEN